ncbi:MAG: ATP-binding cassette subfamily B bacterial MsbA [Puniceicoccaceae bacterium 5H]|nr:MAG: ATP-binding cassette subfamily B bacterial MsbA [Puniceicoccaceae bacterium 5H]
MDWQRYLNYIREQRGRLLIAIPSGALAGAFSGFGVPFFVQKVFSELLGEGGRDATLWVVLGAAALLPLAFLGRAVFMYLNGVYSSKAAEAVLKQLRRDLFAKLQSLPLAFYERHQVGDLIARVLGDAQLIQSTIRNVSKDLFIQPFVAVGALGYLIYLSVTQKEVIFLLILLLSMPAMLVPVSYVSKHVKRLSRKNQAAMGRFTSILAENMRALLEVRTFNLEDREQKRFDAQLSENERLAVRTDQYYNLHQPSLEMIGAFVIAAAFVYSQRVGLGIEIFIALAIALYFTGDPIRKIFNVYANIQKSRGALERIDQLFAEPEVVSDAPDAQELASVSGLVRYEDVSFHYNADDTESAAALDHVSVTIQPGTVCALVGPSGAGKSTFVKLLTRLYDPTSGAIRLDESDLRQVKRADVRRHIAVVPQAPFLFDGTVADNLRIGKPDATAEEMEAAARAAYAHEFIERLPAGYDTPVGEDATRLSGGQRQRLALARAFLKNAPILVLDEATSALDAESEQKIQQALEQHVSGKTVFIIAHRFSTIRLADRILLFDEGRIVGDNTFDALLAHPLFRKLYENQRT